MNDHECYGRKGWIRDWSKSFSLNKNNNILKKNELKNSDGQTSIYKYGVAVHNIPQNIVSKIEQNFIWIRR